MGRLFTRGGSMLAVFLLAASVAAPASAAELHFDHRNTLGEGDCEWHFVQNHTPEGTASVNLTLNVNGAWTAIGGSHKVVAGGKVHHWTVPTSGSVLLVDATTDAPGKLLLSHLTCEDGPSDPGGPPSL